MTDSSLYFRQAGEGEPLLLIHGLFGSLENLGALARPLAETFKVYSLDLPNHGRSPHVNSMNLKSMTDDLLAWLDEQKLQQVHLLGHSLGGKVAMELALRHPQRVKSLIVLDIAPVDYPPHHNQVFAGMLALDSTQLQSRSDADRQLQSHVPETAVRSFLLKNLVREPGGGFSWRMNLSVIHRDYQQLIAGNRSNAVFDGNTLFIKGGNSDYLQTKYRSEILERFPRAAIKIVPGTGHWLHAEKPELVARLVKRFLQTEKKWVMGNG
jgi:esterase